VRKERTASDAARSAIVASIAKITKPCAAKSSSLPPAACLTTQGSSTDLRSTIDRRKTDL